jgi:hypothetical protein
VENPGIEEIMKLKRLVCSVKYDVKGGQSQCVTGEGWQMFFMKPKIISWNVRPE